MFDSNEMDQLGFAKKESNIFPSRNPIAGTEEKQDRETEFASLVKLFEMMQLKENSTDSFINDTLQLSRKQSLKEGGKVSYPSYTSLQLSQDEEINKNKIYQNMENVVKTGNTFQDILGGVDSGNEGGPEGPDGSGTGMPDFSQIDFGMIGPTGFLLGVVSGIATEHAFQTEETDAIANQTADPTSTTVGHDPSQTGITGLFGMHDVSDEAIQSEIDQAQLDVTAEETQAVADTAPTIGESEAEQAEADAAAAAAEGHGVAGEAEGSEGHDSGDDGGNHASGGQIKGHQDGEQVLSEPIASSEEQADTELDDLGIGPVGVVNDPEGTTTTADDLDLELPDKSYVLNAEAVELTGKVSINKMIKEAIDLAVEDGVDLPAEIKTAEKVPIRISQGEAALPHPLDMYIGTSKLEKMNNRGLRLREQREGEKAPVEMAATPSPEEDLLAQVQQPVA